MKLEDIDAYLEAIVALMHTPAFYQLEEKHITTIGLMYARLYKVRETIEREEENGKSR